jgi:ATP-dependent Clp protease ATP-binding subunit ClpC
MFDRFTDRAKKVMRLARDEAIRLRHAFVDPSHIVIGIAREGTGVAANVLRKRDVEPTDLLARLHERVQQGKRAVGVRELPLTPPGKAMLEFALEEADALGHGHVGTQHLLLGALRLPTGPVPEVLRSFALDLATARSDAGGNPNGPSA